MADDCDKILENGIRNELHYQDIAQFHLVLNRLVFLSEEDLRKEKAAGGLSVPIADFLLKFGASSEDVREYKRLLQIDERLAVESTHLRQIQAKLVSVELVEAWKDCKKNQRDVVLHVIGESKTDPGHGFIVNVEYMPAFGTFLVLEKESAPSRISKRGFVT